jgi:hypothetical protein
MSYACLRVLKQNTRRLHSGTCTGCHRIRAAVGRSLGREMQALHSRAFWSSSSGGNSQLGPAHWRSPAPSFSSLPNQSCLYLLSGHSPNCLLALHFSFSSVAMFHSFSEFILGNTSQNCGKLNALLDARSNSLNKDRVSSKFLGKVQVTGNTDVNIWRT